MTHENMQKLAELYAPKPKKLRNAWRAFLVGGLIGVFGEVVLMIAQYLGMDETASLAIVILLVIAITMLLTGLGVYDKLGQYAGAGCFIPISGFANSLCACALEYKQEGPIYGIGSNMFKLAGSVLTYGITFAYITVFLRWLVSLL